ncbi:N-acetyltransferase GCN5 [Shewanella sairae]|uniref:N-acetyltransferase GCN5 n=1 Tax=Shewanella sairae TaxID=190310 RepID=A0ABQ4PQR9_9GAMM|nr:GNAT family N-acetyltransferase [Shewanella sairae]MCL1131451.1 GNAT family N-acetyltransferase [Shewanella sairae]GIU51421.1 N-acetyltransferase GCN5 [Shewanella sairae]
MQKQAMEDCRAVYLTAEDLRIAASILYNAYHDDPFFRETLFTGDQAQYEQKLRGAIREELNELWQQEQALIGVFAEKRMVGVACIVTQQVPLGEARYWHWRLKMLLSAGWHSTQALIKKEHQIIENLPSSQCGILQFIAIANVEQRKGYGGQLITAVQSWCDEQPHLDGVGVFVNLPAHIGLFRRHHFEIVESLKIGNVDGELLFYRGIVNE